MTRAWIEHTVKLEDGREATVYINAKALTKLYYTPEVSLREEIWGAICAYANAENSIDFVAAEAAINALLDKAGIAK